MDSRDALQSMVSPDQTLTLRFDKAEANRLLAQAGRAGDAIQASRASLTVIFAYGDFTAATNVLRSDATAGYAVQITRASCGPQNRIEAFFKNPFANLNAARTAPRRLKRPC